MRMMISPLWVAEDEGKTEPEVKTEVKDEPKTEPIVDPAGKAEAAGEDKTEVKDPPKKDWRDDRLAQQSAKIRSMAEQLKKSAPVTEAPKALDATEDFNQRVATAARQQAGEFASAEKFNSDCNAAAVEGMKTYGNAEFKSSVGQLQVVAGTETPEGLAKYNEFLAMALETDEAPRLIYELGQDPDEAMRILALPPRKMAIEVARKVVGKDPVTVRELNPDLPKPIKTVNSLGARHEQIKPSDPERSDQLPTGDWMARREAEVLEYNKAHGLR